MLSRTTRHMVDPELLPLLDAVPTVQITDELLPQLRIGSQQPLPFDYGPVPDDVDLEILAIDSAGSAPAVPARLYRPRGATGLLGCVLHIHGGGYVCGAAAPLERSHRTLASQLGCVILSVDYRLAPETRFPGAVEDCYTALAWLHDNAAARRIDAKRIGVMGESAGGGLAAALALMARDRRKYALAFQHLIYPMLDDRSCVHAHPNPHAGEFVWTRHNNDYGWRALLGVEPGSPGVSHYAAPARAASLDDLPPTYLATAALDLFLEENLEYARRLLRAGVPTELRVFPGAFHGFDLSPTAAVAIAARNASRAALRSALQPTAARVLKPELQPIAQAGDPAPLRLRPYLRSLDGTVRTRLRLPA